MGAMETWRPVHGYEGYYEASNMGRIRSVPRTVKCKNGAVKRYESGLMHPSKHYKNGYMSVMLSRDGKPKRMLVHRLVAQAFVPNPSGLPEINHKDENKENNAASNLEWCDRSHNMTHNGLSKRTHVKQSKPVKQIKEGKVVAVYPSAMAASRATGITQGGISGCCRGELKTSGGYQWALL